MASRTQLRLAQLTGSLDDTKAAAASISETSIQGVLDHLAASIKRIHGGSVFQNQTAGAFSQTIDVTGAVTASAGVNVGGDLDVTTSAVIGTDILIGDDAFFNSDGAIINFGADDDVNLTHVADTGLLLNSTRQLQFGDSGTFINQASDGVLQVRSDTVVKAVIGATDALTINSSGATFGQNVTITGNLDVNGTTTTIDTQNLTVEDSIIGLGVSGSDGSWSDVGDRGIVFAKGAAGALLPAFYYSGDDSLFQLGLSATSAASGTFVDPTQGNHSTLRLGKTEFGAATDYIGLDAGTGNLTIESSAALVLSSSSDDIIFKDGGQELLTLDSGFSHNLVGSLTVDGNGSNPGALILKDADDSNQITIKAAGTVTGNYELILPAANGSANQVLRLNGSGTALEFADETAASYTKGGAVLTAGVTAGSNLDLSGLSNVKGTFASNLDATAFGEADLYINGALMLSGSVADVSGGNVDYRFNGSQTAVFTFNLEIDDVVQVLKRG